MHASSAPDATRCPLSGAAGPLLLAALACCALPGHAASAEQDDKQFDVYGAVGLAHEDNVFRQPGSGDPDSDMYRSATAGIRFSYPLSAQQFLGEAQGRTVDYDQLNQLNHEAWSVRGAWLWRAGSRFDGQLGVIADSSLASLANLSSGAQSSTPNRLRQRRFDANGTYHVGVRWLLRGGVNRIEHRNRSAQFRPSNMDRDEVTAGLTYLSPSGNSMGVDGAYATAKLPVAQVVGFSPIDNSHSQRRFTAFLEWVPSEKSRVILRGGHVGRDYRQFSQRDFSSWSGSATYEWRPSARLTVVGLAQRDVSENEQVNVGYVMFHGIALRPVLQLGDKTTLAANLQLNMKSYRGDVALGPPALNPRFRERVSVLGLDMDFRATSIMGLRLYARQEARHSGSDAPGYRARIAGLELRATF
jgi:hypothetical protein